MIYLIGYLLTGIACVIWDFRKPFHDRPAYARRPSENLSMIQIVVVAWPPIKIIAANRGRQWGEALKAILTFIVLSVGGNQNLTQSREAGTGLVSPVVQKSTQFRILGAFLDEPVSLAAG